MIYPEYENNSRVLIPRFMKYIMQRGGQYSAEISFWTVGETVRKLPYGKTETQNKGEINTGCVELYPKTDLKQHGKWGEQATRNEFSDSLGGDCLIQCYLINNGNTNADSRINKTSHTIFIR